MAPSPTRCVYECVCGDGDACVVSALAVEVMTNSTPPNDISGVKSVPSPRTLHEGTLQNPLGLEWRFNPLTVETVRGQSEWLVQCPVRF